MNVSGRLRTRGGASRLTAPGEILGSEKTARPAATLLWESAASERKGALEWGRKRRITSSLIALSCFLVLFSAQTWPAGRDGGQVTQGAELLLPALAAAAPAAG